MSWRTWTDAVIADLARYKRVGVDFPEAWRSALIRNPPRNMEMGPAQRELDDELPVLEFFEQACSDAWHGRRRELEDLGTALEGGLARDWPTVGGRFTMPMG